MIKWVTTKYITNAKTKRLKWKELIASEVTKFASFLGPDNDEDSYENHSTDQSKVSTTKKSWERKWDFLSALNGEKKFEIPSKCMTLRNFSSPKDSYSKTLFLI